MTKIELKNLKEVYEITPDFRSKEREERFTGFYAHWCSFVEAHLSLGLRDTVLLVHGPQGCVGHARIYLATYSSQYFGQPFIFTSTTDIGPTEPIMGAEEKLRQAILQVDRIYKPKLILLLTTCAAGIIKEPVDDVVKDYEY